MPQDERLGGPRCRAEETAPGPGLRLRGPSWRVEAPLPGRPGTDPYWSEVDSPQKMYEILRDHAGEIVSLETLVRMTGYEPSSILGYFGKKLKKRFMCQKPGPHGTKLFKILGVDEMSFDDFLKHVSQTSL